MKTTKKVIEKISLPLMFVMFVVAVLVFAVSPVSAAPSECGEVFCDQDNDGFYREHKRCPADCADSEGIDCDDSNDQIPKIEACPGVDPPPAESYPLYHVFIDQGVDFPLVAGSLLPGEGWDWIWNGRQVGSTYAQSRIFPLDMSYISPWVGNFPVYNNNTLIGGCFGNDVTFGGFFRKHKKSTANGMLWFPGTTSDGLDNVLYLLQIDGSFDGGPDYGFPGNDEIMYMTDWALTVENQGAEVTSRACVGSGKFYGYTDDVPPIPIPIAIPVIFVAQ